MSTSARRVVVTGLGLITPLGLDVPAHREAFRTGRSGVTRIEKFDPSGLPVQIAGAVRDFDPRQYLDKKDRKRLSIMAPTVQYAVAAAQQAMTDAALTPGTIDPTRLGVLFGAGTIPGNPADLASAALLSTNGELGQVDLHKWGELGIATLPPTWMLTYVPNMLACHVSIIHNAQGLNNTITQGEAAGLLALGEAYRSIAHGHADAFIVGNADATVNPITFARHCLFSTLSHRNAEPACACRPFDRHRDGIVLGEGAAVLILEEREHAQRRGVRTYAEIVGFGCAFDTDRSGYGLVRARHKALTEADVRPSDLDHVNARGNSTIDGDAYEARALHEVFDGPAPAFAPRSYIGSLNVGSPLAELGASLLAGIEGSLPPTLNFETVDPACPVSIERMARPLRRPDFLKVSFTSLGQCAAVVCRLPHTAEGTR